MHQKRIRTLHKADEKLNFKRSSGRPEMLSGVHISRYVESQENWHCPKSLVARRLRWKAESKVAA
jgi:hypothetical protein